MKALIVEDLPGARDELVSMLARYPDIQIAGQTGRVVEAARLMRALDPHLLFLDVELEDGSGFDLLDILGDVSCCIIFTTASDEHAVRAFRFAAIDYLLKPIDPQALDEAIQRAKANLPVEKEQLKILKDGLVQSSPKSLDRLALHTMERIDIVRIGEIIRVEADGNYSIFYLKGGKRVMVTKTLKEFDKLLSGSGFLRVHQSHLINRESIEAFNKLDGGYLILREGEKIPVSSRRRAYVIESLGK